LTRRDVLAGTAGGVAGATLLGELLAAKAAAPGIRLGVCDWSLGLRDTRALDAARRIGLDGVEISPSNVAKTLSYVDAEVRKQYKAKMAATGLTVCSLATTLTNSYPLATDPRAPGWLTQTIDTAAVLGAKVILLAFFGKGDLLEGKGGEKGPRKFNRKAVDAVVARLKAAAPHAKAKGITLGIESWMSGKQHLEVLDAVAHDSVGVYYDIANSTRSGYDVPAEIRELKGRICQLHFKDNKGSFDSGDPKMGPIVEAVKAINYRGWIVLERAFGRDREAYFKGNARFVRKAFGLKAPTVDKRPVAAGAVTNSVGMKLVLARPGEFVMGSGATEKGRHDDETPHPVRITRGFHIAAGEVTQAVWQDVMGYNPSKVKGESLPVHGVSWTEAVAFCKKLSAKEGKTYRLPTEAEWEYACRAGSTGAFAGCGEADKMAWHMDNSGERPREVGTRQPNAWGIYDMHGNAMEWTADWYASEYGKGRAVDPTGPAEGKLRVARGGSWLHFPRACRSAARLPVRPASGPSNMSFRVVMEAAGGKQSKA